MGKLFFLITLLLLPKHAIVHVPKHTIRTDITPGCVCSDIDADFKEYRYPEHIAYCQRNVSEDTKKLVADFYDIPKEDWHLYEFDHLIPLSVGGSNKACNIWPQLLTEAREKDALEVRVYYMIKRGAIRQYDAIAALLAWHYEKRTVNHRIKNYKMSRHASSENKK